MLRIWNSWQFFWAVLELIENCFQLNDEETTELWKAYYSITEISYDFSTEFYSLRKYKSIIKFQSNMIGNNINFLNKNSSLLNSLFNCLLCVDKEPILLIGPSVYFKWRINYWGFIRLY